MLTSKQRAFLRKMAHDMDPIFQVGKAGVTPDLIKAIDDALEARELIKLTVLKTAKRKCAACVRKLRLERIVNRFR